MASTTPTRVDPDVFASAKLAASHHSRSTAQQISHWARIGQALEASPSIGLRDINRVLNGDAPYDDLDVRQQAIVRAVWSERIDDAISNLDLAEEFEAEGRTWVEFDDDGEVATREARPRRRAR